MTRVSELLTDRVNTAQNFIIKEKHIWPWYVETLRFLHYKPSEGTCDICGLKSTNYQFDKYKIIFESHSLNWTVTICINSDACKYIQSVRYENT
jgi:hypothetical protein